MRRWHWYSRPKWKTTADKHYREALSNRKDARILNNYGSFLFEQKRYPEAMERFSRAAEDNMYPERARVFQNLGMTALQLGKREEAESYFSRSLRLDGRQPRALLELAMMAYEDKQYVPAKRYYDSFSQMSDQTARSLLLGIRPPTSIRTATRLPAGAAVEAVVSRYG